MEIDGDRGHGLDADGKRSLPSSLLSGPSTANEAKVIKKLILSFGFRVDRQAERPRLQSYNRSRSSRSVVLFSLTARIGLIGSFGVNAQNGPISSTKQLLSIA